MPTTEEKLIRAEQRIAVLEQAVVYAIKALSGEVPYGAERASKELQRVAPAGRV